MSIRDEAHYRLTSADLADWLEQQGDDVYWIADGAYALAGRVYFPCTGDELATVLRKLNRPMLVQDQRKPPLGRGEAIGARDLDALVVSLFEDGPGNGTPSAPITDRQLFLNWAGDEDWALVEDVETTESERQQAAAEAAGK